MCGYHRSRVLNSGECECTQCSPHSALQCATCNKFPGRARREVLFLKSMETKCNVCRGKMNRGGNSI